MEEKAVEIVDEEIRVKNQQIVQQYFREKVCVVVEKQSVT